jgi:hypothetical protein
MALGIGASRLNRELKILERFSNYLLDPNNGWVERFVGAYGARPSQAMKPEDIVRHALGTPTSTPEGEK